MPIWNPAKFKPLRVGEGRPSLPSLQSLPNSTQKFKDAVHSNLEAQLMRQRDQSYLVGPGTAAFLRGCILPRGALGVGRLVLWETGAWWE